MPRACPVEPHDLCYLAGNVNPPRLKAVASSFAGWMDWCSGQRDTPRDKPVASLIGGQRDTPRGKPVASLIGGQRDTPRGKPVASLIGGQRDTPRDKPVALVIKNVIRFTVPSLSAVYCHPRFPFRVIVSLTKQLNSTRVPRKEGVPTCPHQQKLLTVFRSLGL